MRRRNWISEWTTLALLILACVGWAFAAAECAKRVAWQEVAN